jgi:hypothetical protein
MREIIDRKATIFCLIILGIILQVSGRYLSAQIIPITNEVKQLYTFENFLTFLGTIILMFGIVRSASVRKSSSFWCLLAFMSVIGVCLLFCIRKQKEASEDGLTEKQLNLLIYSSLFLLIYLAVHLKNYYQVGYFFHVVKGDLFDLIYMIIELPGSIATGFYIIFMFWNIHSYSFWMSETVSIICNCVFYSYFISTLIFYFHRLMFKRYVSH